MSRALELIDMVVSVLDYAIPSWAFLKVNMEHV